MPGGYARVRFIGFAIPTTPADMVAIGDPNGTGSVAGTYRARSDFAADVAARTGVLKAAVDTAVSALPADADADVLNVFVAPEFYWHGPLGPYVFAPGEEDPADVILARLQETFPASDYPNFLFVLGSVISSKVANLDAVFADSSTGVRNDVVAALGKGWLDVAGPLSDVILDMLVNFVKNGHAYPNVEVRNRALVLSPLPVSGVTAEIGETALTTEKYFDSNEDFLLWDVTGKAVITEQMTSYPVLDITGGDFKSHATDHYAIFRVPGNTPVNVGVEICLDHADRRLRKNIDRNPWPERADGIDLHLIPSCGMQIHPQAAAARAGGWVFNVDGQYALEPTTTAGVSDRMPSGGVASAHTDYVSPSNAAYGAHTQLARVQTAAVDGNEAAPGARNAVFDAAPDEPVHVVPVIAPADLDAVFAGGPGAVHIYGLTMPLPIRAA